MKNLQNLKGAHVLSKKEQQSINGGGAYCGCSDGRESSVYSCNYCNDFCGGGNWLCVGDSMEGAGEGGLSPF